MLRTLLIPALVLPLTLGCASLEPVNAADLSPGQASLINATCSRVMGLRQGEFYYAQCQDSLTHSLARKAAAEVSAMAADACRDRGSVGSSAFAVCALNAESRAGETGSRAALTPVDLSAADAVLQSSKKYYDVTPSVQFQRERYACAELGLVPGSGLFGTCVASLEGALSPNTD